ncbi:hypothetical protein [Pontibacter vulgaris]|uniref:hypothetical protein n=1 Tax=Pontibacter vulgaris TaxID=2905679 RepID=UPI001FA6F05D|nr:hypothetical protein [Pontibacter vulgaris]
MERFERNFGTGYYERDNEHFGQEHRGEHRGREQNDLSSHLTRYTERGNYFGMPHHEEMHRDVRSTQRSDFNEGTMGPMAGQGGGRSYRSGQSNYDQDRNRQDHYHYGDPNPYMNYDRNGGYDRTRGTGWRSERDDYMNSGNYGLNQPDYSETDHYARQENSYRTGGQGRRFTEFGRDERHNYGHDRGSRGQRTSQYSENLDDRYFDRSDAGRSKSENDYGRQQSRYQNEGYDGYGSSRRYQGSDNYGTGSYSSNRAYLSDQSRERGQFDRRSDEFPSRSNSERSQRSGPDYSKHSPISNYGQSDMRG